MGRRKMIRRAVEETEQYVGEDNKLGPPKLPPTTHATALKMALPPRYLRYVYQPI